MILAPNLLLIRFNTRFTERYYGAYLGRGSDIKANISRLWFTTGDVVEFKSMPDGFSAQYTRPFAKAMAKHAGLSQPKPPYIFGEHEIRPDGTAQAYLKNLERWQFCGHFSRSKPHEHELEKQVRIPHDALL